jgi:nucleoside 2-deoxyribosyltransferase
MLRCHVIRRNHGPCLCLAIEPALKDCGLDPRRVDKILDNRHIDEKIIAELRDSEFVVADFTLQRNGVYFEAGFARGLGREVFWCCREDDLKNLHFDTRPFSFIVWKDLDDLKQQLTDKIKALGFARN